ncbi:MAG: recombinase family protein, partial [Oscillospiraceae bacterium]|nr:recombinase family protein [Oscillospiraceae bacterium]
AVAYTRVSSEKQIDNHSLDFQEKTLKNYAQQNNINLIKIFREEGKSGTNTNRPAYLEMIQFLEEHDIDMILVHKLDRLHRDEDNMYQDIKRFRESSIRLVAVGDGIDTAEDSADLAIAVLTAIGANFSRNLRKETLKGLTSAAEECMHTGGKPPYGFKVNQETMLLEIDETTAPAVRKMFELYADGFGTSDIIKWLKSNGYKTSNGNGFKVSSINEIFHNEKYKGCYTWNKAVSKDSDGKRNTHKHKDSYIQKDGGCPEIVTPEIFDKVQKRLAENAEKHSNRTPDRYYPLTGITFCECGSPMCGGVKYSKGRKYYKYSCNHKCGNSPIRAEYLEAFVINAVSTCLFSEPNRQPLIDSLNALSKDIKMNADKEYRALKSTLSGLEIKHQNLMNALEKGKAVSSITNGLDRIERKRQETNIKISKLSRQTHSFTEEDLQKLQDGFNQYLIAKNTINNKYLLKKIIDRIEVSENQVDISLKCGININKSTKAIMKGNDSMVKNNFVEEYKTVDGIFLGFCETEADYGIGVKIALKIGDYCGYDTILDLSLYPEHVYAMADQAEKDIFELVGEEISVEILFENDKVKKITEISLK